MNALAILSTLVLLFWYVFVSNILIYYDVLCNIFIRNINCNKSYTILFKKRFSRYDYAICYLELFMNIMPYYYLSLFMFR